jgi:RNA polymerase sigma-70 factor (ECF subfamily)
MSQERSGHTLQATALVNEAYLRLVDVNRVQWQNRAHFFAIAAQMMRRVLVEFARGRGRQKRGCNQRHVSMDQAPEISVQKGSDLIALNDALSALSTIDQRMSQIVELRFFGGLTVDETSKALNISPETVLREWNTAKVWLLRELSR